MARLRAAWLAAIFGIGCSSESPTSAPTDAGPGADAGSDSEPDADSGSVWEQTSCNAAASGNAYCSDVLVCAASCSDATCLNACLDTASAPAVCQQAIDTAECIDALTASGAACEHCRGFLACTCGGPCPDGGQPDFSTCYSCLSACNPGSCMAGGCL